ncbi:MAG: hypothetical protein ACRCT1_08105 [Microcoleaceae cyanobacterium]
MQPPERNRVSHLYVLRKITIFGEETQFRLSTIASLMASRNRVSV